MLFVAEARYMRIRAVLVLCFYIIIHILVAICGSELSL